MPFLSKNAMTRLHIAFSDLFIKIWKTGNRSIVIKTFKMALALKIGRTLAILSALGNIPLVRDKIIMKD